MFRRVSMALNGEDYGGGRFLDAVGLMPITKLSWILTELTIRPALLHLMLPARYRQKKINCLYLSGREKDTPTTISGSRVKNCN